MIGYQHQPSSGDDLWFNLNVHIIAATFSKTGSIRAIWSTPYAELERSPSPSSGSHQPRTAGCAGAQWWLLILDVYAESMGFCAQSNAGANRAVS